MAPSGPEPITASSQLQDTDAAIQRLAFAKGKDVLGPRCGGQITQLAKALNGSYPQVLATLEAAASKHDPREYIAAVIHRRVGTGPPNGELYDRGL